MRIVQLSCSMAFGDAIGNHIALLDQRLKENGYETAIYASSIHPRYLDIAHDYRKMIPLAPDDIMLYHMSTLTPMNQLLKRESCRKIMMFHNLTPPVFFENYDTAAARGMEAGLQEVRELRPFVDASIVFSEFSKRDLIEMGYEENRIWVMPSIFIPFDDYDRAPDKEMLARYSDGWTNILFVGRLAPNKKQEDIIRAYTYYKLHVNPRSRLILVGAEVTPAYSEMLRAYVKHLGVEDVIFPGHISFPEIIALYRSAHVFLCMSEHEGFCVPLIEAMRFEIPVIAYASTAIPGTLDGSGILLDTKDPVVVSRIIERLQSDPFFRAAVIERQRMRLNTVLSSQSGEAFFEYLNIFIRHEKAITVNRVPSRTQ